MLGLLMGSRRIGFTDVLALGYPLALISQDEYKAVSILISCALSFIATAQSIMDQFNVQIAFGAVLSYLLWLFLRRFFVKSPLHGLRGPPPETWVTGSLDIALLYQSR